MDQLQPDPQSGWRDLSFLPQGPGNPPPGIVFVLGTRPNDTLRPLEVCRPLREYRLLPLSDADFVQLLQQRQVELGPDLVRRSYEALQGHALFLDLLAQDPALRERELQELLERLSRDPGQLFTRALDRLRGERELWRRVIKPVLGLLLVAQEPLTAPALRQVLTLTGGEAVDLDEVQQGLPRLGGLVVRDQQGGYSLFQRRDEPA